MSSIVAGCFSLSASAAQWFVAPTGSDAAAGTAAAPFASVQHAQEMAQPGDTVYLRGGTYRIPAAPVERQRGLFARIVDLRKSGQPGRPITYTAFPGERPVFDASAFQPAHQRVSMFHVGGSWLHLVGLEVIGVQVTITGHTQSICFESQGSHNVFERCSAHDGQAIGFYHVRGSDNLFLHCDAWNNWDHTSENRMGGNVDGFGCHPLPGGTNNVFRGCRAWYNSDDGYDCLGAYEAVVFEDCWAFMNGFSADGKRLADGNGFKAGGYGSMPAEDLPRTIPRHVVRFCIAAGNKNSGFYANHHPGGVTWINNSAFRNGADYNLQGRLSDNRTEVDGAGHLLLNNLSHGARHGLVNIDRPRCRLIANAIPPETVLQDRSFVNLDEQELLRPRQPDGSLPSLHFLRPASGSPLIDQGTANGRPCRGKAPDIGALEF